MFSLFFSTHTATTEIYTLSLHDALPISNGEQLKEVCSVGFRANGNDGHKYILTAGHCVKRDEDPNAETLWSWETADSSARSEEHTSELQSHVNLVCRLLLEKKKKKKKKK